MYCHLHYISRPPKSAKKSRAIWDALTDHHKREPSEIGLYVSEGGFRDWHIRIGGATIDLEDAIVGKPSIINPENAPSWPLQQ